MWLAVSEEPRGSGHKILLNVFETTWSQIICIFEIALFIILRQRTLDFSKLSGKTGQILEAFFVSHPPFSRRLTQGLIHSIGMLMASLSTHHKLYSLQNITFISRFEPAGSLALPLALALETEITALLLKHNCYCILEKKCKTFFFSQHFCWW